MGQRIARDSGARYRYVECAVDDADELRRRLQNRQRLRSQVLGLGVPLPDARPASGSSPSPGSDNQPRDETIRPSEGCIRIDTLRNLEVCVSEVLQFPTDRAQQQ